jgi:pyruvate/2-oxoglutarate dehydrogenase complex dihydrolipoamide acyltransferase (E2) component
MAKDYVMPKLAMAMNEGTIAKWVVEEGAHINQGEILMVVETEKVTYDLESPDTGYFHIIVGEGETVPVETVIGQFAQDEAELAKLQGESGAGVEPAASEAVEAAPAVAASAQVDAEPAAAGGRIKASPLARKMARDRGIDLALVSGTGPGGRIVKRDVLKAKETGIARQAVAAAGGHPTPGVMVEKGRIPIKGARATIAKRMVDNLSTMAQVSHMSEIDITKLMAVRKAYLAKEKELGTRVSLNAFFIKALEVAVRHVPIANASVVGDEIVIWENVNVGFAVALPGDTEWDSSLIVPVIKNVEQKGLLQIDREMRDLVARARAGELVPEELSDATITVSSTAGFAPGWAISTPIVNAPQTIIVQPGTAVERPVVVDGEIVIRTILPFSLTFDHRVMDGEPLGRFYTRLHQCIEDPSMMLL